MAGEIPRELNLVHGGDSHRLLLLRGVDKLWEIQLDGEPWAHGRRLRQGEWYVFRDSDQQLGRTLEGTVTTFFYRHMQEQL